MSVSMAVAETLVCDIQRFSVHDGPGIRTTVFFKGCPLACEWCHNPETISFANELVFTSSDCIACGDCIPSCGESAIAMPRGGIEIDRASCTGCMHCTAVCPSGALSPAAKSYDSESLLGQVLRDTDFYGADGGITLSGGEPLARIAFLGEFLPMARAAGLHVVAETAGHWQYETLEHLLGFVDLFLFDVKVVDEARHREYAGRSNARLLANLERLIGEGRDVTVRMPVVPGRTDGADNLSAAAELLLSMGVKSMTLLPYHALGESKLPKIASRNRPLGLRAPTADEMEAASASLARRGIAAESA